MKKNLFFWYPFKENSTILEITKDSEKMLEDINIMHMDESEIDISNKEDKYDYVILYKPNLLEKAITLVKPKGTVLLATNNRFAISYFAGASYNGRVYNTITENAKELYGKKELQKILKNLHIKNYKFYYPLPNYKKPMAIFSDEYMPNKNTTKLMYNITYEKGSIVVFDELKALKQVTNNGLFDFFANSFLIEMKLGEEKIDSDVKFVSFNNNRKEEYQLETVIKKDEVIKKAINNQAIQHIENIKANTEGLKKLGFSIIDEIVDNEVISKYINQDTFDQLIITKIMENNKEDAYNLISDWYEYIKARLIKNRKSKLNKNIKADTQKLKSLTVLKNGYIDLVFENTFYNNGDFLFFDQEWYEEGIPLEFLLYRAINNMYSYNSEIEEYLKKTEIFEKFDLLQHIELFEEIEKYIQGKIISVEATKTNEEAIKCLRDINYISIINTKLEDFEENDKKQNEYIKALEEDNRNKQVYIEKLEKKKRRFF